MFSYMADADDELDDDYDDEFEQETTKQRVVRQAKAPSA